MTQFTFDSVHSALDFQIKHLMVSKVHSKNSTLTLKAILTI